MVISRSEYAWSIGLSALPLVGLVIGGATSVAIGAISLVGFGILGYRGRRRWP